MPGKYFPWHASFSGHHSSTRKSHVESVPGDRGAKELPNCQVMTSIFPEKAGRLLLQGPGRRPLALREPSQASFGLGPVSSQQAGAGRLCIRSRPRMVNTWVTHPAATSLQLAARVKGNLDGQGRRHVTSVQLQQEGLELIELLLSRIF